MHKSLSVICVVLLVGCASQKNTTSDRGNTRTKEVPLLDNYTYLLTEKAADKTYGFTESNPIDVGGNVESGAANQRRFLNALLGPNGEEIKYYRAGSCCPFKTRNAFFNNIGLLDSYRISWEGSSDTLTLYLNLYDQGDLKIPVGLTAKKGS
jgi:hypothetical protein